MIMRFASVLEISAYPEGRQWCFVVLLANYRQHL